MNDVTLLPVDQQLVLAAWSVVVLSLAGLGVLARRALGPEEGRPGAFWTSFWTGWAILLALLQAWHLFAPVDDRARISVIALGAIGLLSTTGRAVRVLRGAAAGAWARGAFSTVAAGAIAYWLSHLSMAGPRFGDTGMYFVPTVHWYDTHAIVPGLANLFVPLGHNLSYLLYAALLDGGPLVRKFWHVANSVLVFALLARGITGAARIAFSRSRETAADLFHVLAMVPTVDLATTLYLTSPSPDTGVYLFGLALAGELVALLADREPERSAMLRVVFLAAVGMTLKVSIAGLSVVAGLLAWAWWARRGADGAGHAVRGLALAAFAAFVPLGTWMVRNAITSGLPLYPASWLGLSVDWIMRADATEWIQKPMAMAPLATIFTAPDWWRARLVSLGWGEGDVLRPLAMAGAGLAAFLILRTSDWWRGRRSPVSAQILLAPVAGFVFCFVTTPMPRYQGATIWILGADLFVLALAASVAEGGRALRGAVIAAVIAAAVLPVVRSDDPWPELSGFQPTSPPRVRAQTLASGLVVSVPENQVCWYAELPCTPEPAPGLRLRREGDLAAGFAVDVLPNRGTDAPE